MAMALNPLWNYKPRTQRIKLLLQRSSSGVTFLAWHFRYSHRFPDPGLKRLRPATQHLAINILQAYLKYPEKYCRSFTPGAQCHCHQSGTSRELSLMLSWCWLCWPTQARTQFPLKSKHSNTSQPQEVYLSVCLSIYLPIYLSMAVSIYMHKNIQHYQVERIPFKAKCWLLSRKIHLNLKDHLLKA